MHRPSLNWTQILTATAVLFVAALIHASNGYAQERTVYWADREGIYRVDSGGESATVVATRLRAPVSLALDLAGGKAYWASSGRIERANIDGSRFEVVLDLDQGIEGIALDVESGKMYWANYSIDAIQRANFDGTEIEDLVTDGVSDPQGITLDLTNGKVYWVGSNFSGGLIHRANLDGTDVEELVAASGVWLPWGIRLDIEGGKMYWADIVANNIQRANLDGTEIEELVSEALGHELDNPSGLALDLENGNMYWVDRGTTSGGGRIERANLDGTEIETLVDENLEDPNDLAIDPVAGALYWTDGQYGTSTIWTSDLEGSDQRPLLAPIDQFGEFLVDGEAGHIYWSDRSTKIQRSDLDGNQVFDVVTDTQGPQSVRLVDGSVYWVENGSGRIRRFALAGGVVEDVVTNLSYPIDLVVAGGMLYWMGGAFANPNTISSAAMDGSGVQELVNVGELELFGFAVNAAAGKLYWAVGDRFAETLHRADLDGTNAEELTSVESFFADLTIDVLNEWLYWIDVFGVNRSGLDGSGAELVVEESRLGNLVLDAEGAKMYFSQQIISGEDEVLIHSADLDGSNMTQRVGGLERVDFIALGPGEATANEVEELPARFEVSSTYPNPFNVRASFELTVPSAQHVSIALYDALGRQVRIVHQGGLAAQRHRFTIEGNGLASGLYFIRIGGEAVSAALPVVLSR